MSDQGNYYQNAQDSFNEFQDAKKSGKHHGHPKLVGAAVFLAMKRHDHEAEKEGKKPVGTFKDILAAYAAAEIDKLVEEKVIPAAGAELHKEKAKEHAHAVADERYQSDLNYLP